MFAGAPPPAPQPCATIWSQVPPSNGRPHRDIPSDAAPCPFAVMTPDSLALVNTGQNTNFWVDAPDVLTGMMNFQADPDTLRIAVADVACKSGYASGLRVAAMHKGRLFVLAIDAARTEQIGPRLFAMQYAPQKDPDGNLREAWEANRIDHMVHVISPKTGALDGAVALMLPNRSAALKPLTPYRDSLVAALRQQKVAAAQARAAKQAAEQQASTAKRAAQMAADIQRARGLRLRDWDGTFHGSGVHPYIYDACPHAHHRVRRTGWLGARVAPPRTPPMRWPPTGAGPRARANDAHSHVLRRWAGPADLHPAVPAG